MRRNFASSSSATAVAVSRHFRSAMDEKLRSLCFAGRLADAVELLCRNRLSCVHPQTYALLLQESIHRNADKIGRRIHAHMVSTGLTPGLYLWTKLVIFYAKLGDLWTARQMFDRMLPGNIIPWNALISGYVHKGLEQQGLDLYYSMRSAGILPDQFTFASVFRACARLAMLEHGKRAHGFMIKMCIPDNVVVSSALVDMYLKCSSLEDGHRAFDWLSERNVVTWTALISGYGQHGYAIEVLELFKQMIKEGFRPNSITFLAVLSACSHGGLADAGWRYFSSMMTEYGIRPKGEHYAAMVDMLGRAGRLHEAYELVKISPCQEHSVVWGALLGACRIHSNVQLLKLAAKKFFKLQPANAGKHIVLSNTYATFGMWQNVVDIRRNIQALGMKKDPAWSSIEIQGVVHTFLVQDSNHDENEKLYETIKALTYALAEAGYVSNVKGN